MKAPLPLTVLLLACAACAHTPPTPPPPAPAAHAPTPFTAEQIRGASSDGRAWVFLLAEAGKPAVHLRMEMSAVGCDTVALTRTVTDASTGEPLGEAATSTATWPELVAHAAYPTDSTTVADDTIEVPGGRFDAMRYTVSETAEGVTTVTEAWFAPTLPGPPVLMFVRVDGTQVTGLTLLEHTPGAAP